MVYENLDADLVNSLLENGRTSLRSLGGEIGVSVTTISNHLTDLEEEGVISSFTPVIDYQQLGYNITAIFRLRVDGEALPTVAERLQDERQMTTIYEVTGEYDIIAVGEFKETEGLNDQIKRIQTDEDVKESNTDIVLNKVCEFDQFELDRET